MKHFIWITFFIVVIISQMSPAKDPKPKDTEMKNDKKCKNQNCASSPKDNKS
jgi:hypothetical protein